jgi:dihydroorotase
MEGYDADLTIVDMTMEKEVRNEDILSKAKVTPFDGYLLKGWPVMTIVNGNIVYDGDFHTEKKGKELVFF